MAVTALTHCSHPHQLFLKNYQKPYICDGCGEQGFGSRYRCEPCDYDLHKDCAFFESPTSHKFLNGCAFEFFLGPGNCVRYCEACGKLIHGFLYHCKGKDKNLHPCCRNLRDELAIEGIKFQLRDKVSSKCIWCKQKNPTGSVSGIRGWSYVSKCKTYRFHVYCAREMVNDTWKKRASNHSNECPENVQPPLSMSVGSGSSSFTKMVKVFFKKIGSGSGSSCFKTIVKAFFCTISGILSGDPTTFIISIADLLFQ